MRGTRTTVIITILLSVALSACGAKDPIRFGTNTGDDELVIAFDEAGRDEERHIGNFLVKDGEVLCVKAHVQRGSAEVSFSQGTRRLTAPLDAGFLPETPVCGGGGFWVVDAKSTGNGTKGKVRIYKRRADAE